MLKRYAELKPKEKMNKRTVDWDDKKVMEKKKGWHRYEKHTNAQTKVV